jgi:hypothetical protein
MTIVERSRSRTSGGFSIPSLAGNILGLMLLTEPGATMVALTTFPGSVGLS